MAKRLRHRQALGRHRVVQRHAGHVLHYDERHVALLLHAVDGDDVRVVEGRGGPGLAQQARSGFRDGDLDDLDATVRLSSVSRARYTVPMPPWPRRSSMV